MPCELFYESLTLDISEENLHKLQKLLKIGLEITEHC